MSERKKFPVCVTFDVDCQTIWTARDTGYYEKPVMLSLGNYGAYEGVPRILRMLAAHGVRSTFNVPGEVADLFPEMVVSIAEAGHEIGNHSYHHTWPEKFTTREEELEDYRRTNERLKALTGTEPRGFRSPAWEFSKYTPDILVELGFLYSSNMMHCDSIHQLEVAGERKKLIEFPIHWAMDDAAYWLYSTKLVGKAMQPLDAVEEVWKRQFDVLYQEWKTVEGREHTVYVLTCHPQVIGVPARSTVLERTLQHMEQHTDVEFFTLGELARQYEHLLK